MWYEQCVHQIEITEPVWCIYWMWVSSLFFLLLNFLYSNSKFNLLDPWVLYLGVLSYAHMHSLFSVQNTVHTCNEGVLSMCHNPRAIIVNARDWIWAQISVTHLYSQRPIQSNKSAWNSTVITIRCWITQNIRVKKTGEQASGASQPFKFNCTQNGLPFGKWIDTIRCWFGTTKSSSFHSMVALAAEKGVYFKFKKSPMHCISRTAELAVDHIIRIRCGPKDADQNHSEQFIVDPHREILSTKVNAIQPPSNNCELIFVNLQLF